MTDYTLSAVDATIRAAQLERYRVALTAAVSCTIDNLLDDGAEGGMINDGDCPSVEDMLEHVTDYINAQLDDGVTATLESLEGEFNDTLEDRVADFEQNEIMAQYDAKGNDD